MTKLKKQKKKGILEFFGIKETFFKTSELKGDDIKRFADRKDELQDLKLALELKQNYAVIGDTGTGKSSLLHKFQQEISDSYYSDYLYFSIYAKTDNEMKEELFRTILSRLLILIIENDELMESYNPDEINTEIERLDFSISIEDYKKNYSEISPEIEASFPKLFTKSILPIDLKAKLQGKISREKSESKSRTYITHSEESLRNSIDKLTRKLPAPVVLFIDEMDRIIKITREVENWLNEVIKILQFCTEMMTNENLRFIFALQPEIYEIFNKAYRGEGDDSILRYVPAFKKIGGFDMAIAGEVVGKSLKFAGYKGKIEDLFELQVMEAVLFGVNFNPRQFAIYLTDLTKHAYKKDQHKVTMAIFKDFLAERFSDNVPARWSKWV